ncbi:MAG: sigma-70 family RNA polymerase sigma factor [Bryobacterales bacterium]|nr:sigma-70 family RNA polymerase sigma factor [Bryobacterales bacterium]
MQAGTGRSVTELLTAASRGDFSAREELVPLVYAELRRLARRRLARERPNHTLQPTALVHEAYMRLIDHPRADWQNRAHFFAVAAEIMRRVLVDYARRRQTVKRGGGALQVALQDAGSLEAAAEGPAASVLAVEAALTELTRIDPRKARLVELRFFGGLSIEETAEVLGVSPGTVMRDWTIAKAFLKKGLVPG